MLMLHPHARDIFIIGFQHGHARAFDIIIPEGEA